MSSINDSYIFYLTKYIIKIKDSWFLAGKILIPNLFNNEIHDYNVNIYDDWFICEPRTLYNAYKHRYYNSKENTAFPIFNLH